MFTVSERTWKAQCTKQVSYRELGIVGKLGDVFFPSFFLCADSTKGLAVCVPRWCSSISPLIESPLS